MCLYIGQKKLYNKNLFKYCTSNTVSGYPIWIWKNMLTWGVNARILIRKWPDWAEHFWRLSSSHCDLISTQFDHIVKKNIRPTGWKVFAKSDLKMNDTRPWHCFLWPGMCHVCWQVCQPLLTNLHIEIWSLMQLEIPVKVCICDPVLLPSLMHALTLPKLPNNNNNNYH